jgi:alpha-ribazole phosphatase
MEFVLIRHTPCDVPPGVCYGRLDLPLASTAVADIADTLSRTPTVQVIYASPAQRCMELARHLAARDLCHLEIMEDLQELNFGAWEGQPWNEIARHASDAWADDPWNRAPPAGETERELFERVERFARLVESATRRVAVIAHGGPLRILRCLLLRQPLAERWSWTIAPGEVVRISLG